MTDDDRVNDRLRSLTERTAGLRVSRALTARLAGVPSGDHDGSFVSAIARLAVPSLVAASLGTAFLFAVDAARDHSIDDDVALAATMDVGP
jgi:hypothetical protein